MKWSVWIGWDDREAAAFAVARESCRKHNRQIPIYGLLLSDLQKIGLYKRPIRIKQTVDGPEMWDEVSQARQSTQHANARFWVPHLAKTGWALFVDGDVLFRGNVAHLFEQLDKSKALYCVHHDHRPVETTKMDGQEQVIYPRKNQSSVMAFNCDHPANKALTLDLLNTTPGRDLHRFCWLSDADIGELPSAWNHLVGYSDPEESATIAHFTSGIPDMQGFENVRYASEWRDARDDWARGALSFGS